MVVHILNLIDSAIRGKELELELKSLLCDYSDIFSNDVGELAILPMISK